MSKRTIGTYLSYIIAALLAVPALGKVAGMEPLVEQLSVNQVGDWITIIGLGLLVSAVLFVLPKTKLLGTLLLSSYFGGAIVFHMALGEPFMVQAGILLLIWITTWLRGSDLISK